MRINSVKYIKVYFIICHLTYVCNCIAQVEWENKAACPDKTYTIAKEKCQVSQDHKVPFSL